VTVTVATVTVVTVDSSDCGKRDDSGDRQW
jgi:hypothetical protein